MFNKAGKVKQGNSEHSFDFSILEDDDKHIENPKLLKLNWKSIFIRPIFILLSIISLMLIPTIWESQNVQKGWKEQPAADCLWFQEQLCKTDTVLKASVIAMKLLIGNVERNPGPVDLKEFLAFLFVDAEDASVKEVLKEVKAAQDWQTRL